MGYVSFQEINGQKEWYNHTHSHDIYRLRKETVDVEKIKKVLSMILPLPKDADIQTSTNIHLPSHQLIGKKFIKKDNQEVYVVEKVCLQFYGGWHYCLLLNCNGSHCLVICENHSCMNESILSSVLKFKQDYRQV